MSRHNSKAESKKLTKSEEMHLRILATFVKIDPGCKQHKVLPEARLLPTLRAMARRGFLGKTASIIMNPVTRKFEARHAFYLTTAGRKHYREQRRRLPVKKVAKKATRKSPQP